MKELSLADSHGALVALLHLKEKGVSYPLPGGQPMPWTPFDHGVEGLVALMDEMETLLRNTANMDTGGKAVEPVSPRAKHVVIKLTGGKKIDVKYNQKTCSLKNQEATFLLALKSNPAVVPFRDIWDILDQGDPYVPDGGGPPPLLRTLKSRVDRKLLEYLGQPPGGEHWLVRDEAMGYGLYRNNGLLVWAIANESWDAKRDFIKNKT